MWVLAVPVESLGLLLGRVLDGLKGVLDFSEKALLCKLFGARSIGTTEECWALSSETASWIMAGARKGKASLTWARWSHSV